MNHEQAERLLSARIDGERLSTRASASLEQHLATCAECRAFERGAYRLREAARFQVAPVGGRRPPTRMIHGRIVGLDAAGRRRRTIVCHRERASLG